MVSNALKELQAPIKAKYRADPGMPTILVPSWKVVDPRITGGRLSGR